MTMNALGAFAVALIFIASNLYVGGYKILDLGHRCGAISAWVGASITLLFGLILTGLFIRAYKKQKRIEAIKNHTLETGQLI